MPFGDFQQRTPPFKAGVAARGVMHLRRRAKDLRPAVARGLVQRLWQHALCVHRHPNHLGAQHLCRAAKPGVGEVFDQHHRLRPREDRLQYQYNPALPAMRQHDVTLAQRPEGEMRQPVDHRLPHRGIGVAGGIVHQVLAWHIRHLPQGAADQRHLPHVRQARAEEADRIRIGNLQLLDPTILFAIPDIFADGRLRRGDKGATAHLGL